MFEKKIFVIVLKIVKVETKTKKQSSRRFNYIKTSETSANDERDMIHLSTTTSSKLIVLQYNVHKFKNQMMTTCLRDSIVKNFHIIAIQKSWFNLYFDIIHHFFKNNHDLIYSNSQKIKRDKIRICFFINKKISLSNLNIYYRTKDLITTKIKLQ